jgi:putative intracellular protease/amidase
VTGAEHATAILLYPGFTALDAIGPWEVLSRIPDTEVRLVWKETGPLVTDGEVLLIGATHTLDEILSPDVVLVPGGVTTPTEMLDREVLEWLRQVHATTTWTARDDLARLNDALSGLRLGANDLEHVHCHSTPAT